jgi:rhodanese-related sulfurtransferase
VAPPPPDAQVPSITVGEAANWLREHDHVLVVDVREPWEYAAGHLPDAVSIPQADLALRLREIPQERDILVVCAVGGRSLRAAGFLRCSGYDRVASLAGGTKAWIEAGHPIETAA